MEKIALAALAVLFLAHAASAEEQVVSDMERPNWSFYGDVKAKQIDVEGVSGGKMLRAKVKKAGVNFWDSAATTQPVEAIEEGKVVTLGFYARAASEGEVWIQAAVAQISAPYKPAVRQRITLTNDVQFYCVEGVSPVSLRAGEGKVTLHLGSAAQTIDLGPYLVTVRDAQDGPSQLPCQQIIQS